MLAACSPMQSKVPPSTPIIADQWSAEELQQQMNQEPWLNSFANDDLNALVAEAMGANYQLRSAQARAERALAEARIIGADRYPELTGRLDGSRQRQNPSGNSRIDERFSTGLDINWELDVWGKLDARTRAAVADYEASQSEFDQSRFNLASDVAKAWFNVSEARMQLNLVEERERNQTDNVDIIRQGYLGGINDSLDLYLARAELEGERSRVQVRKQTLQQSIRELEILLGRYPATALSAPADVPLLTAPPPAGIPSELLLRREDLIAARLRLRAADARAEAAHLARYPSIRLSANGGYSSDEVSNLMTSDYLAWSLFGGLTAPLWDAGRLESRELRALAEARESEADYSSALQRAFSDVEQSLNDERLLLIQQESLKKAVEDSIAAEKLAFEQYRSGLVEFVTVLESRRRSFASQSDEIDVRNRLLQNRIKLFLALGGDFGLSPSAIEEP